MKTRIISAIIGIILFCAVIALSLIISPMILYVALAIVGAIGVYEALVSTKYVKSKFLIYSSLAYALLMPFFYSGDIPVGHEALLVVYGFLLFTVGMFRHKSIEPTEITYAFSMTVVITFCFWAMSAVFSSKDGHGLFYLILVFLAAWACDTGAYFSGYFFGKHKMAPEISPKKTIEGAIGGVIFDMICMFVACLIFNKVTDFTANTILLVALTPILAFTGMIGDLIASYIKRACDIKDYGNIMPGHGGILDRFDSVMTVVPFMYIIVTNLNVVI